MRQGCGSWRACPAPHVVHTKVFSVHGFPSVAFCPSLALQCVVGLHLHLLGGSRSGAASPQSSTLNRHPPLGPQSSLCHLLRSVPSSLKDDLRLMCKPGLGVAAWRGSQPGASRATRAGNVRFVAVGWRRRCPFLAGASGFESSLKNYFRVAWVLGSSFSFETCFLACSSSSSNSS